MRKFIFSLGILTAVTTTGIVSLIFAQEISETPSIAKELQINAPTLENLGANIAQAREQEDIIGLLSFAVQLYYLENLTSNNSIHVNSKELFTDAVDLLKDLQPSQDDSLLVKAVLNGYRMIGEHPELNELISLQSLLMSSAPIEESEEAFGGAGSRITKDNFEPNEKREKYGKAIDTNIFDLTEETGEDKFNSRGDAIKLSLHDSKDKDWLVFRVEGNKLYKFTLVTEDKKNIRHVNLDIYSSKNRKLSGGTDLKVYLGEKSFKIHGSNFKGDTGYINIFSPKGFAGKYSLRVQKKDDRQTIAFKKKIGGETREFGEDEAITVLHAFNLQVPGRILPLTEADIIFARGLLVRGLLATCLSWKVALLPAKAVETVYFGSVNLETFTDDLPSRVRKEIDKCVSQAKSGDGYGISKPDLVNITQKVSTQWKIRVNDGDTYMLSGALQKLRL